MQALNRFLVQSPHLHLEEEDGQWICRHSVTRSRLRLSNPSFRLLEQFQGGSHEEEALRAAGVLPGDGGPRTSPSTAARGARSTIEKLLDRGVLEERVELSPGALGRLVLATPEAVAPELRDELYPTIPLSALPEPSSDEVARARTEPSPDVLEICRRPDERWLLAGSGVLARAAHARRQTLAARVLPPRVFLRRLIDAPGDFFGTQRGDRPYQSLFDRGRELIRGRRPDLLERLDKVRPEDLQDRTVLDLGCNIGMGSILAARRGARQVLGIDFSEDLVQAATRLNTYFAAPCEFRQRNLETRLDDLPPVDTIFLFAVLGHLDRTDGIVETVRRSSAEVVYVESHCEVQERGETNGFLKSGLFSQVEMVGHSFDNVVRGTRTRTLHRGVLSTS